MSRLMRKESVRQGRIPVASNREPLIIKGLDTENFHHRWVTNTPERLEKFLMGGWEFCNKGDAEGPAGERTVESSKALDNRITKAGGGGVTLYLMRIPIEFWEEDQAAKQADVRASEEAMKRPTAGDYGRIDVSERKGG